MKGLTVTTVNGTYFFGEEYAREALRSIEYALEVGATTTIPLGLNEMEDINFVTKYIVNYSTQIELTPSANEVSQ